MPSRNGQLDRPPILGEQGAASSQIAPYAYIDDVNALSPSPLDIEKMIARDGQAATLENAIVLPVIETGRDIEEAEGDTGEAEFVRDKLLKPHYQGGMTTPLEGVIEHMATAFARRIAFFEKVWQIDEGGYYCYHKVAYRRAATCEIIEDKNGSFNGFRQKGYLESGETFEKDFAPNKAFVYIHGRNAQNPLAGVSAFEAAYQAYVNKRKIQFLQAMYLQKFGLPTTPIEVDSQNEDEHKAALAKGEALRGGGVVVFGPNERLVQQTLTATSNAGDFKEAIEYYDNQMARSMLVQFLTLGQGSNTGAWALSRDHSDFFIKSEEARLRQIEWHIDNYLIAPLVYFNFGENASYPTIKFQPIAAEPIERAIEMYKDLIARALVTPKPALVEAIEEKIGQVFDIDPDKLAEDEVPAEAPASLPEETVGNADAIAKAAEALTTIAP